MSEITRHLSYNDINLLKKNRVEKIEQKEINIEKEENPKERQD